MPIKSYSGLLGSASTSNEAIAPSNYAPPAAPRRGECSLAVQALTSQGAAFAIDTCLGALSFHQRQHPLFTSSTVKAWYAQSCACCRGWQVVADLSHLLLCLAWGKPDAGGSAEDEQQLAFVGGTPSTPGSKDTAGGAEADSKGAASAVSSVSQIAGVPQTPRMS